jgi:PAS domain S-box-containing protein
MDTDFIRGWWKKHIALTRMPRSEYYHEPTDMWFDIVTTLPEKGRFATIFINITDRIQAEKQIRRLALIAKETDNMVIITDTQGNIEWVNEGFIRLSEYTFEEAIGTTPGKLLQRDGTDPDTIKFMHHALAKGEPFVVEVLNYTKSGKEYWVQIHSEPLYDNDGKLINFFALQLDITKLKRREEQLRRSEAQLRAVFDSSSQSYWLTDTDLRVLAYNKIASRGVRAMLDCDIELGANMVDYVLPTEQESFLVVARKALGGEAVVAEEHYMLLSGEELWYENLYTPTYNDGGIIIGLTISSSNVTERHRARRVLEEMNQSLEQRVDERTEELSRLNLELTEIMGIAAHDLKNPLAGILSSAEILERYYVHNTDNNIQRFIGNIILAGSNMLNIITNLLELNRIESGQMRLEMKPIAATLVADTIEIHSDRASEKNITFHQRYPADNELSSILILADEGAFRQVLDNLVSNAVKYSPHGSNIFVRVALQDTDSQKNVRIEIEDEGPGISEEDKKKLFGKFARLSARPTGGEHSTGLGLSIVKKMVEAMNGKVWCESELGKGATFIVELPSQTDGM